MRFLVAREGVGSEAALRLINALFAADELEEAVTLLEQRASLPGTTLEDKLRVAEQLFGGSHFDRALRFYMAVLDVEPENAAALLRVGQIRSWTNDPRGAIPPYDAMLLLSPRVAGRDEVVSALSPFVEAIGEDLMRSANGLVDRDSGKRSPPAAAEALRRWIAERRAAGTIPAGARRQAD